LLEARLLQARWSSLHRSLEALGPARQRSLSWEIWQGSVEQRGETVVLVHTGRETPPQRMELWLHLLLAAAAGSAAAPRAGLLIAREQDRIEPRLHLACPPPEEARRQLERLGELRQRWRQRCWPVPPRCGMAYLEAERSRPGSGPGAAADCWEGAGMRRAERQEAEMALCFGADRPIADLLGPEFVACATDLYGVMLEAKR
jgi:exodeoxyribonuclease V gamma subunit